MLVNSGCLLNQGLQGSHGKIRKMRAGLKNIREKSGHSTNAGNIQGNIRAFD